MRLGLPPSAPGMRIGLYGGSFNPAHLGHRHVTLTAIRRLGLDRVWWLVTPGNPLKDARVLAPLERRCAEAERVADHPRIAVTGFEATIRARYTRQTLRYLTQRRPGVHFVWIMGADSLASFHRWKGAREIAAMMPIAIVDRPGFTLEAPASRAARLFARARVPESEALTLPLREPPAWIYLHGPRSTLSSTQIRNGGRGQNSVLQSASEPSTF
ncbi:nicotinate-nucleotide adenylyltransferase [Methylobacterium radiodurans]|uniref:Probable nicotinate-nucleotide adenylyltransferase n=1 Tax=Methylobacterium radiodurans TaxID=2202828 RepID=A0A2U8VX76_9HYPH|nr:nicotinate-nucleotide adenylyltransferase [Methylobacterium radiodurans]AWN38403.1 nicotinic acid mononucleotide adenylyltransferase [Methylobacterium radiodurans]